MDLDKRFRVMNADTLRFSYFPTLEGAQEFSVRQGRIGGAFYSVYDRAESHRHDVTDQDSIRILGFVSDRIQ